MAQSPTPTPSTNVILTETSDVDPHSHIFCNLGISLAGIAEFLALRGGRDAFKGLTTTQVCNQHMVPCTEPRQQAYVACFPGHSGEATAFVSHAWAYPFLRVVEALESWSAKQPEEGRCHYFWFDLFINSQHCTVSRPFEWWRDTFSSNVAAIGRTLLILEWPNPEPLRRAWCLLEITASLAPRTPPTTLEVVMAPCQEAAFFAALLHDFPALVQYTCTVDVAQAQAFKPDDRDRIFQALQDTLGFQEVNKRVIARMREWMLAQGRAALQRLSGEYSNASASASASVSANENANTATTVTPGDASVAAAAAASSELPLHVARLLQDAGLAGEAEVVFEQALGARRGALGEHHPATLEALGEHHPATLEALHELAWAVKDGGRVGESEGLFRRALEGHRHALGPEHPATLRAANSMGVVLQALGRLTEAEPLYREALEGRVRTLGGGHLHTLASCNSLGWCLLKQAGSSSGSGGGGGGEREEGGQQEQEQQVQQRLLLNEAGALLEQALEGRRSQLGVTHPDTLMCINNMAVLREAEGDYPRAEALLREAHAARARTLGDAHHRTLQSASNLASVLLLRERSGEAETLLRSNLELRGGWGGVGAPLKVGSASDAVALAKALMMRGGESWSEEVRQEAVGLLEGALAAQIKTLGQGNPTTTATQELLSKVVKRQE